MTTLRLVSPLTGWAACLDEVPDPAFSQRVVGDGIAIDPLSAELRAPCNGVIASVHEARHACTLRAETGAELLLHVGVDSVNLRGEGFTVHVREGQSVKAGDPLIAFDMDLLARGARSLMVMVVVVNGETHTITERVQDQEVAVGEPLLEITGKAVLVPEEAAAETAMRDVRLPNPHGLHARPAAVLARRARLYAGTVRVGCKTRTANGKSVVSLMGLGARQGDTLTLAVRGRNAVHVVQELAELVRSGLGEPPAGSTARPPAGESPHPVAAPPLAPDEAVLLEGTLAVPGLAVGQAVRVIDEPLDVPRDGLGVPVEERRLADALASLRRDLEAAAEGAGPGSAARTDIFRAHLALLDDPELAEHVGRELMAGRSAAWAWRTAIGRQLSVLRSLADPLILERIGDLRDLERRVLALLTGKSGSRVPVDLPRDAILVADELLPSELAWAPAGRLAALCMARGGPTSHVAILAAGMGLPVVVALGDAALRVPDGAPLIVDGDHGKVRVFPPAELRETTRSTLAARAARREAHRAAAREPCRTVEGVRIDVLANLGRPGDAAEVLASGADGCGLLRTEFLFLERHGPPSEDEQAAAYQQLADALEGRPLVIRTLDAGGDKPLAYLPLPHEQNPALGLRGVRASLRHPELLRTQLRAILRVKPATACRILVPMVTSPAELRAVRAMAEAECQALGLTGQLSLGAMIEVPLAAMTAEHLASEADFLSIGTNDLIQYALAMDRGHPLLAAQLDGLHPGVLRLIHQTVAGARAYGRPVSVCGGLAADPRAAALLVGLGITELSAPLAVIPELKAFIRSMAFKRCLEVAREALELECGEAVRALLTSTWPDA